MLIVIAIFKLLKAALLFTVALGMHRLLRPDAADTLIHWARVVRVDPQNRYVHAILSRITGLSPHRLRQLSIGTIIYGTLFAVEGAGLLSRMKWAEWMVVITTGLLLPVEVYEVFHRFRWTKLAVLAANVAMVVYLIVRLMKQSKALERIESSIDRRSGA